MKKNVLTLIVSCLFVNLISSAMLIPPTAQAAETPKRGGWLTVATDSTPVGLDPHITMALSSMVFFEHCYETLIRYDAGMNLEPSLATSWKQPDDTTYIFYLRKGVKFHNGDEMTAEDVKFTFERIIDPAGQSPRRTMFKSISKIEAIDKYTVKFTMSAPSPSFLSVVGSPWYAVIISKAAVQKYGNLQNEMIGTGPFKLKKYEHGVKGVFERFDDYWEKPKPYIDGFDLIVINDETARVAGLRKESIDIGWVKPAQLADLLSREKNLTILEGTAVRQQRIWFRGDKAPFNNVKVRQAVASAIDRKEMIDTVLMGRGTLSACIPPATVPFALSVEEMAKLPFYKQDIALSKKLLAEAGYPNGFEFTCITSPHSPDYVPTAQVMQRQLAKAGVKMNIEQRDWGITLKTFRAGDFTCMIFAGEWFPDPEGYSMEYLHSKASANFFGFKDEKLDKLFETQRVEVNIDKRIKLWHEIQRYAAEIVPCIWPYASTARFEVVNKKIRGYKFRADNSRAFLSSAWVEK